jgi:hypothetical protein
MTVFQRANRDSKSPSISLSISSVSELLEMLNYVRFPIHLCLYPHSGIFWFEVLCGLQHTTMHIFFRGVFCVDILIQKSSEKLIIKIGMCHACWCASMVMGSTHNTVV